MTLIPDQLTIAGFLVLPFIVNAVCAVRMALR
jgi:hypothetical protein